MLALGYSEYGMRLVLDGETFPDNFIQVTHGGDWGYFVRVQKNHHVNLI